MTKPKKFDLGNPGPVVDDEDEETLAAIDEGMGDAEAGRTVPAKEVRRCIELHAYRDALVRKGLEEMRKGRVVSHSQIVKRLKRGHGALGDCRANDAGKSARSTCSVIAA